MTTKYFSIPIALGASRMKKYFLIAASRGHCFVMEEIIKFFRSVSTEFRVKDSNKGHNERIKSFSHLHDGANWAKGMVGLGKLDDIANLKTQDENSLDYLKEIYIGLSIYNENVFHLILKDESMRGCKV